MFFVVWLDMIYSSSNLRYFLLAGPLSLKHLRILRTHETDWRGCRLRFYALGASHAVSLVCRGTPVTELLTCIPAESEALTIAEASTIYLPLEVAATVFGMRYRCRISFTEQCEGATVRGSFDADDQIEASYPVQRGYPAPVTRIAWRLRPAQLYLETMHTYPEEGRVIRTESTFGFPESVALDDSNAQATDLSLALK